MSSDKSWDVPKVWTPPANPEGRFASINRPTAGARTQEDLPRGEHPFQLYSLATPNGQKVTILFEELLEEGFDAEYDAWLINIGEGEQFSSGFVDLNPNSKIPALLDSRDGRSQRVFESGAILLYLAESFGAFLPKEHGARTEALNWLFWQMGSGPLVGGGFGHFYAYAPEKIRYAIDRYAMETKRLLDVLDQHLAKNEYLAGDEYSIADMASWPWYGALALGKVYSAGEFLSTHEYTHVLRWANAIAARPAVQRGVLVNNPPSDDKPGLIGRHASSDFDGLF